MYTLSRTGGGAKLGCILYEFHGRKGGRVQFDKIRQDMPSFAPAMGGKSVMIHGVESVDAI
jgi:hypothetical protein